MTQEARDAAPRGFDPSKVRQGWHLFKDGTAWCAVGPHFQNLGEDKAGFGSTQLAAYQDLKKARLEEPKWSARAWSFPDLRAFQIWDEPDPSPAAAGQESDAAFVERMASDQHPRRDYDEAGKQRVRVYTADLIRLIDVAKRADATEAKRADATEAERDRLRSELAARTGKVSKEAVEAALPHLKRYQAYCQGNMWGVFDYASKSLVRQCLHPSGIAQKMADELNARAALEAAVPFMPAEPSLLPGLRRARELGSNNPCQEKCQYAVDVSMLEHSCSGGCQYNCRDAVVAAIDAEIAAVSAQTEREGGVSRDDDKYTFSDWDDDECTLCNQFEIIAKRCAEAVNCPNALGTIYGAMESAASLVYERHFASPAPQAPPASCGATDEQLRSIKRNEWLHYPGGAIEVFALRDELLRLRNQPAGGMVQAIKDWAEKTRTECAGFNGDEELFIKGQQYFAELLLEKIDGMVADEATANLQEPINIASLSSKRLEAVAKVGRAAREQGHDVIGVDDFVSVVEELLRLRKEFAALRAVKPADREPWQPIEMPKQRVGKEDVDWFADGNGVPPSTLALNLALDLRDLRKHWPLPAPPHKHTSEGEGR